MTAVIFKKEVAEQATCCTLCWAIRDVMGMGGVSGCLSTAARSIPPRVPVFREVSAHLLALMPAATSSIRRPDQSNTYRASERAFLSDCVAVPPARTARAENSRQGCLSGWCTKSAWPRWHASTSYRLSGRSRRTNWTCLHWL